LWNQPVSLYLLPRERTGYLTAVGDTEGSDVGLDVRGPRSGGDSRVKGDDGGRRAVGHVPDAHDDALVNPLLGRLRRDGLVTTTWRESASGPPRRYYRLTADGRRALDVFAGDWRRFTAAVDALLPGPIDGGDDGR
jgi:hypothetical protein